VVAVVQVSQAQHLMVVLAVAVLTLMELVQELLVKDITAALALIMALHKPQAAVAAEQEPLVAIQQAKTVVLVVLVLIHLSAVHQLPTLVAAVVD
jgi:hypothetical protein